MSKIQQPLVDINTASLEELTKISGIGPILAQRIIGKRPYQQLKDLIKVSGINETKFSALLPFITFKRESTQTQRFLNTDSSQKLTEETPITKVGNTEAFLFLEDRNERQDALLIIFGGFILGLLLLLLRRSR